MKANYYLVLLILAVFFVISFLTNILGPIIPDIIDSFNLNLVLVALLPFAFFIAYGVMSIPAGVMVEKFGGKAMLVVSFLLAFIGALLLAAVPAYYMAIASLFVIGFICLHIYLATLGSPGAFRGMTTGKVDAVWAAQHHSEWSSRTPQRLATTT